MLAGIEERVCAVGSTDRYAPNRGTHRVLPPLGVDDESLGAVVTIPAIPFQQKFAVVGFVEGAAFRGATRPQGVRPLAVPRVVPHAEGSRWVALAASAANNNQLVRAIFLEDLPGPKSARAPVVQLSHCRHVLGVVRGGDALEENLFEHVAIGSCSGCSGGIFNCIEIEFGGKPELGVVFELARFAREVCRVGQVDFV